jgi:hypothetical protein
MRVRLPPRARCDLGLRKDRPNTEDETGLPWAFLDTAADPSRIAVGRYVIAGAAGAADAVAVAQVVDVTEDGIVHVRPVRGSVDANRHLLDTAPSQP